jgi:flavin-dependent dehydrogenase
VADHLHGADDDGLTTHPPTIAGMRQAIVEAHLALDHIDEHLVNDRTRDDALECCQANVQDLMVALSTWQALLERTRTINRHRN